MRFGCHFIAYSLMEFNCGDHLWEMDTVTPTCQKFVVKAANN